MKRLHALTTILALCAMAAVALVLPPARADVRPQLKTYTECRFRAPIQKGSVDSFASHRPFRVVHTESGDRKISVLEGYRMMLETESGAPFVNLKFERSANGKLAEDRAAILAQMQSLAGKPNMPASIKRAEHEGIEVIAIDHDSLQAEGVIGIVTLIDKARDVIVTGYFLNAAPEKRAFQTEEAYKVLRDQVVSDLYACLQ